MQINKTNNVILLKNVESNLIDEAFIILKNNVNLNMLEKNDVYEIKTKKDILKEAELLINQEIDNNNLKYEKFKITKMERKIKILKAINIIMVIAFILLAILK